MSFQHWWTFSYLKLVKICLLNPWHWSPKAQILYTYSDRRKSLKTAKWTYSEVGNNISIGMRVQNPRMITSEKGYCNMEFMYVINFILKPKYRSLKEMIGWWNIAETTELPGEIVGGGGYFFNAECQMYTTANLTYIRRGTLYIFVNFWKCLK